MKAKALIVLKQSEEAVRLFAAGPLSSCSQKSILNYPDAFSCPLWRNNTERHFTKNSPPLKGPIKGQIRAEIQRPRAGNFARAFFGAMNAPSSLKMMKATLKWPCNFLATPPFAMQRSFGCRQRAATLWQAGKRIRGNHPALLL